MPGGRCPVDPGQLRCGPKGSSGYGGSPGESVALRTSTPLGAEHRARRGSGETIIFLALDS